MPGLVLDITLTAMLLIMAWGALYARTIGASIALFVSFGLILSLTWARLGAPDLALAEAAIGAGLTGVLLLQAAAGTQFFTPPPASWRQKIPALGLIGLAFLLLSSAVLTGPDALPAQRADLPGLVSNNIADSGVEHPVTAVLLNFRAWDTFLELLVLLLALLGFKQLFSDAPGNDSESSSVARQPAPWPLLKAWARILAPLLVITGGYLLWRGASDPGGAFQAGALLAAALVILRLSRLLPPLRWSWWPLRLSILIGAFVFLATAVGSAWLGDGWMTYPPAWSSTLIILIEVAATISIAATLALLVAGDREDMSS